MLFLSLKQPSKQFNSAFHTGCRCRHSPGILNTKCKKCQLSNQIYLIHHFVAFRFLRDFLHRYQSQQHIHHLSQFFFSFSNSLRKLFSNNKIENIVTILMVISMKVLGTKCVSIIFLQFLIFAPLSIFTLV